MSNEKNEILTSAKKVLSLLGKKEKKQLIIATIIIIIVGFIANLPAVILGKFIDVMITENHTSFAPAVPYLLAIIAIVIVKEGLTILRKYIIENIATQTEKQQTVDIIEHVLKIDYRTITSKFTTGSLHGRIIRSVQGLIKMLKLIFLDFFPTTSAALAAILIALYQKPLIAFVMILVIPTGLYIIFKQIASEKWVRITLLRKKEKIDGKMIEMLSWLETIKAMNTVRYETTKIEKIAEKLRLTEIQHHIHMAFFDAFKYLNESFFYVLVVSMSIYFAVNGRITKGDILTYSILFMSIIGPFRQLHRILDQGHESSIKINDLQKLYKEKQEAAYQVSPSDPQVGEYSHILDIQNLSFGYTKDKVLKNISLNIKPWQKIGIVGSSGCGKSTLIKLLLRLHTGYTGSIHLLWRDLQNRSRDAIASYIAYVPQKSFVFQGSIKENVLYGLGKNVSKEKIMQALAGVNLLKEVQAMWWLSAKLTENGNNLSGGQRQRLVLARLLLQNPDIIIFDEASSALDNTNERIAQSTIEEVFHDKTLIIIAHRLQTLENTDTILVFDQGKIVQKWSYISLSQKKWLFRQFLLKKKV